MSGVEPMERVAERLAAEGVRALRLRRVLALLADGWCSLDELVRRPAVERRTVEELLAAAGDDLEHRGERWRLAPGVVPA
ncbi:MAG TPA: putative methyltransferase, partial [Pseudonocardiaceae bacterium]